MALEHSPSQIFSPQSTVSLLSTLKRTPQTVPFAGGTYILGKNKKKYPSLPASIIYLKGIDELCRIHRTERYIEVGACASIGKILNIGSKVLPPILYRALKSIGTPALRNLATLGGNLCAPEQRLTAFPVLLLLDARIELRKAGASRWIGINRFVGPDGSLAIESGEILSRIRIPLKDWNVQVFKRLSSGVSHTEHSLSFCGLAENSKSVLIDFRFAFATMGKTIFRSREIEAELASRKLPLSPKDRTSVVEAFGDIIETMTLTLSRYQRRMAFNLFRWFLSQLDLE